MLCLEETSAKFSNISTPPREFKISTLTLDKFDSKSILIYPNPSNDYINIDFESNLSNVSVEILNSLGHVLILENLADVSSKHNMQIAIHNLPSGLYLLRVKSDHQLHRLNWIKN
jgi:hypothetical protein